MDSVTLVSVRDENARCENELPETAYRPVPATPRPVFPMIGGTDFSYIPGLAGSAPAPAAEEVRTPPAWMCRLLPFRGCSARDVNYEGDVSPGPSEGGVGIGI
jgi:hypothetical protein